MESIRRLSVYLKPYWKAAVIAPLLMVLEVAMDLLQPRMMQNIVDNGIANNDLPYVLHTGLLMIVFAALGAVGGIGCTYFAVRAAMNFGADLRSAMYRQVQALSFGNLDKLGTGQLVTRLTSDVTQVQDVVLIALRILVRAPLIAVGSLIMAVLTSPRLSLILVMIIPVLLAVLWHVIRRSFPLFTVVQSNLDRVNTVVQENLAGVRVVKAFVRAPREIERFEDANVTYMMSGIRAMQVVAIVGPFMILSLNFGVAAVIWFGGVSAIKGDLTLGEIMAFVNYLRSALTTLMMVSMLIVRITRAQASGERILEVFDSQPEVQDRPDARAVFDAQGRVAFEDVTFSYMGGEPVLQHVTFVAEPGQTVAILGTTGSGKSTLVQLIPRFYDVDAGRVAIDGVDVRDIQQHALRANIGIALQEAILFSGSIHDNIGYGNETACQSDITAAAQAAQVDEFVTTLPERYETQLGQRGINLSGGQKQRLSIARALVRKPTILILDDSTSAVDVDTESRIQENLDRTMRESTRFVVAQRISTVLAADKILVLDNGRLIAEGTHHELMDTSAVYREIYESQLGNGVAKNQEPLHAAQ